MRIKPDFNMNKNAFKGVYFSKMALIPSEIRSDHFKLNTFKYIEDKTPLKMLKNIVENTKFFNELSKNTDVFITALFEKAEKSSLKTGHFQAIFKNPQSKNNTVSEVNLITEAFNEESALKNIRKIIENLPTYRTLRKNNPNKQMLIFEDTQSSTIGNIFFNI